MFKKTSVFLILVLTCFSLTALFGARESHAIDKRLKLMFKTAAYGAGGGFVIGAGTAALGLGGVKNAFMGASVGMYAGILFAGYLIATHESPQDRAKRKTQNPYAPRRPIGKDDWEDVDEEEYRDFIPPEKESGGEGAQRLEPREIAIWTPILALEF